MKTAQTAVKHIAVIIPCYNESASIATVIKKFSHTPLQKDLFRLSIYVVDNNSTDNTAQIAQKAGAVVISEPLKGKGHALRAGFQALPEGIDYVVMLDGDDTYSPEEIVRMIEPLQSNFCDVVVGSRLAGRIQTSAMSTFNRLGNWLFTNAVRIVYRANITDALTGYFSWKKETLDVLYPQLTSQGFAIEMEMVTKMARLGCRLTSVPVSYHPRFGESHLRPCRDGLRILRMFIKNLRWQPRAMQPEMSVPLRKIVFVSDGVYPYMKGGKEKRLHEISKRLAIMGYDVHIYTMHWWKGPEKTRLESGVRLHALCRYYEMYHGDRRAIKEGLFFGLACFKLLRVSFDVLDVDQMPFFPIISSWIVCKLRSRKFYGTWHEALSRQDWTGYMGRSGVLASHIERFSTRLPYTITAASLHTKELLASIHGRVERVGLVASGVDMDVINKVEPLDARCDVLYVGRLVKDKNLHILISAIDNVTKTNPALRCIIIGQGSEKAHLMSLVSQLKLQANVIFIDPLTKASEVYAYMKSAKVFCIPSTREGFSVVTLEALACGTPVVTVNNPANAARRLVQDGVNGSIVACKTDDLANAITYWASQAQKPDTCAEIAEYDWHNVVQKQLEVYTS